MTTMEKVEKFVVGNFLYVDFEWRVGECEQNVHWKVSPRNALLNTLHAVLCFGACNFTLHSLSLKLPISRRPLK